METAGPAHTQKHTNMHVLTLFHKNAHKPKQHEHACSSSTTGGNGLAKLNKCNHCDLNGRQSRSDVLKCASPFSLPFSINLSLVPLSHLMSFSAGVTVKSHSFCFLLTTVSFSTFAFPSLRLPLKYFFFSLFCVCFFFSLIPVESCAGTSQLVALLLRAHCSI